MKKYLFIIISILILLLLTLMFISITNFTEQEENKEELVEDVIYNVYYNDDVTVKELENTVDAMMIVDDIVIGPDSALRTKPSSEIIKKYHLEEYEKIQNMYYKAVEERFKNQTKYTMQEVNGKVEMNIIPWNFSQYSGDLALIAIKLMEREGYSIENADLESITFTVNEYKARTLALKILNDYLEYYDNTTNEEHKVEIKFNGNKAKKNEYYTLYLVLTGVTSSRSQMKNPNYNADNDERLEGYITEAINKNLIDEKKPLKII